jgi:hypothetical protein
MLPVAVPQDLTCTRGNQRFVAGALPRPAERALTASPDALIDGPPPRAMAPYRPLRQLVIEAGKPRQDQLVGRPCCRSTPTHALGLPAGPRPHDGCALAMAAATSDYAEGDRDR